MADIVTSAIRSELLDRRSRLVSAGLAVGASQDLVHLLQEVDSALQRIDDGSYGLCAVCHDPIEPERLMADPLTTFCLDHLSASQRRALEEDLELAVRTQATLLPARSMTAGGWEACYHYQPARAVSGDYCDLVQTDDGLFFAMGDVSGKGVAASLLMSHLHAMFRSLLSVGMPVPQVLGHANRIFCQSTLPSNYATLACGRAAPSGEVVICNAGHCPPLMLRRNGIEDVEATGLPLGLFCEGKYAAREFVLDPGDCLVLYTDGITEATDGAGDEYGSGRLRAVASQCHGMSPSPIIEAILADVRLFGSGSAHADDIAVLVMRREGGS
jgi:sigma-B regulation protein RsbU (phosphoserine phosphatase)